ncbi:MAG: AEC family transporter [Atopobiaceae bacterium]|nr:AEC family transporter [Atopobiaceae bacterium]
MVAILIKQILVMVVMMAVGVILAKIKMLTEEGVAQLSNIALYVATPAVVISSLAIEFNKEQLATGGIVMLFYTGLLLIAIVVGRIGCGRADRVGHFAVAFSNSGFVGIPLIQGILGDQYTFYVTMTMVVATIVFWTYGVWLMSADKGEVSIKKILTNPNFIAVIIGLIFFFMPFKLPYVLDQALVGMKNLNTGLGMLILGANLGASNIMLMITDTRLYKACILRLLVAPLATLVLLLFMPAPFEVRMVLMIVAAAPAASATSMLAQKYGADYQYGTGLAIGTTLLSMVSMPLVLALSMQVL